MFLKQESKGGLFLPMGVAQFLRVITCSVYIVTFSRRYLNAVVGQVSHSVSSVCGGPPCSVTYALLGWSGVLYIFNNIKEILFF